jgi:hypothetical protein
MIPPIMFRDSIDKRMPNDLGNPRFCKILYTQVKGHITDDDARNRIHSQFMIRMLALEVLNSQARHIFMTSNKLGGYMGGRRADEFIDTS